MDVSIIIVNYNTCQLTLNCLKSIYQNSQDFLFEVIVVDNKSNDNSITEIKKQFTNVVLIEANENLGFGKANNLGVKSAKGKYVFFINSDTVFLNNALFLLLNFFEENAKEFNIGTLGAFLLDENENDTHSYGFFPTFYNQISPIIHKNSPNFKYNIKYTKSKAQYLNVDYVTGACLLMTHELFNNLGGFCQSFFMYFEETDLLKRMNNLGYNSFIVKGPRIIHFEGGSFNNNYINSSKLNKRRIMFDKSRFMYMSIHYPTGYYILFRFVFLVLRFGTILDRKYTFKERVEYIKLLFSK